jgi:protein associated with RNAse G/E
MSRTTVMAMKADNAIHRYHEAEIEICNELGCVVWTQPGDQLKSTAGTLWVTDALVRTLFVVGARLNLLEILEPDSTPRELYMNIIAPVEILDSEIRYIDHELDVRRLCSDEGGAFIEDQDEFEQAINTFNYDESTVVACRAAALQGMGIADSWEFKLPSEDALQVLANQIYGYA